MIARMNYEHIKRYSLTEIALLGFFVLGLMVAQMIVKVRHRLILSDSIPLIGSGLSVSMPTNSGWEYETKWRYESDNSVVLVGQRQIGRFRDVSVHWRYCLSNSNGSAKEILEQRIQHSGARINLVKATATSGPVPLEYGIISPASNSDGPFYLGVASLDFGRHLELRVYSYRMDLDDAEHIFRILADSIRYELPLPIEHGKALTETFWDTAIQSSIFHDKQDEAFLVKNITNQPIGYGHYQYASRTVDGRTQLQISFRQYEHNVSLLESTCWLNGGDKGFTWKTTFQRAGVNGPRIYTLAGQPNGTVTLHTNFDDDKQFTSDSLFLPELFLPQCVLLLLNAQENNVVVDVLSPDGMIVPTAIEKIDVGSATARSEQIAYAVKIDFLNNPHSFEEFYFDVNKKFVGRFEQQGPKQRLWDMTTLEELERLFGEKFKSVNEAFVLVK